MLILRLSMSDADTIYILVVILVDLFHGDQHGEADERTGYQFAHQCHVMETYHCL